MILFLSCGDPYHKSNTVCHHLNKTLNFRHYCDRFKPFEHHNYELEHNLT